MRHTKILELAQIQTHDFNIAGIDLKVREPSTMEMITFRERSDEKEGGTRAHGYAYLFQTCVFNPDMTPAFEKDEAMAIACGSPRVSGPLIKALLAWINTVEDSDASPKEAAPVESSPSN